MWKPIILASTGVSTTETIFPNRCSGAIQHRCKDIRNGGPSRILPPDRCCSPDNYRMLREVPERRIRTDRKERWAEYRLSEEGALCQPMCRVRVNATPSGPCSDSRLVRHADRLFDCIEPCISAKWIVEGIGIKEEHKSVPFAGGLFQPLDSFCRLIQADISAGIIDGRHILAAVLLPDAPFQLASGQCPNGSRKTTNGENITNLLRHICVAAERLTQESHCGARVPIENPLPRDPGRCGRFVDLRLNETEHRRGKSAPLAWFDLQFGITPDRSTSTPARLRLGHRGKESRGPGGTAHPLASMSGMRSGVAVGGRFSRRAARSDARCRR